MIITFKGRKAYPSGPSTVLSIPKPILDHIVKEHGDIGNARFDLTYDGGQLVYTIYNMVDNVENNE